METGEGKPEQAPEDVHDPKDESPAPFTYHEASPTRPSWAPPHYGDEEYPDPYARDLDGNFTP